MASVPVSDGIGHQSSIHGGLKSPVEPETPKFLRQVPGLSPSSPGRGDPMSPHPMSGLAASPALSPLSPSQSMKGSPRTPRGPQSPFRSSPFRSSPGQSRLASAALMSAQPAEPTPRLVINKLVLINFKSYAGRQEIGPFNTNFSAVVGPNGSGKSNVIDSLLFVFGFRANKMRHGKLSNLIHKSEHHPNLDFCRVEVHFQNVLDMPDGSVQQVDNSSLVVSRQVTLENGSSYDINQKRSSFTEVTTLLRNRGIDLDHKRFLILQGEVESIAMMKPKAEAGHEDGLLEYLEDIIGTSDYKKLIEDAEAAIDLLREDCSQKQGRFDFVSKELAKLDDQRSVIETFMLNQNKATLHRSSLLQLRLYQANLVLEQSRATRAESEIKLQEEARKNESSLARLTEVEGTLKTKSAELNTLHKALDKARATFKSHKVQTVKVEEKRQHISTRDKKLERVVQASEREMSLSKQWLDNYAQDAERTEKEIESAKALLSSESAALSAIHQKLREKTKGISDKIEELQQQVDPWRAQIQEKETEIAVLQNDLNSVKQQEKEEREKYLSVQDQAKDVAAQGQATDKEGKLLAKRQENLDEQIEETEGAWKDATEALKKSQTLVEQIRASVSAAKESRSSAQSQNRLVTELLKLRDDGKVKGLYGRLGSLGAIDAHYDVAVSTAAPGLDNLVVDTVETGQKCIEYLRKHNLGRAKFILLDKLPHQDMRPINTPEKVPRLFDLIKPRDAKFAPAFYSVLGNTLVGKDMDQARRVAYGAKRYRVVTLGGMLVETSGAMSGGGGYVVRGKMASKSSEPISMDALNRLERELAAAEFELADTRTKINELEEKRMSLSSERPILETEISKNKLSLEALEKQMSEIKELKASLKEKLKATIESNKTKQDAAGTQLKKLGAQRTRLVQESQSLEAEIQQLQDRIMEAGGVELKMKTASVQDLRDRLDALHSKQDDGHAQRTKAAQQYRKHASESEEAASERLTLIKELEELEAMVQERKSEERALEEELDTLTKSKIVQDSELEELKTLVATIRTESEESRQLELELREEIKELDSTIKDKECSVALGGKELRLLSLHDLSAARDLKRELEGQEPAPVVPMQLSEHTPDELRNFDSKTLENSIRELEEANNDLRVNMEVLADYRKKFQEFSEKRGIVQEAIDTFETKKKECAALKQRRLDEFMAGFNTITLKLKQMYKMITLTGNADLELVDSLDPFTEGISFSVMPPGKSWKNISNLSGGEKTLSSLALVFALHHYKPTPLYVMDEIDAALDFRNVSIIANYIKERTRNGQFIVISLRNNMFELADRLIGIYKVNSMTRSATLDIC